MSDLTIREYAIQHRRTDQPNAKWVPGGPVLRKVPKQPANEGIWEYRTITRTVTFSAWALASTDPT